MEREELSVTEDKAQLLPNLCSPVVSECNDEDEMDEENGLHSALSTASGSSSNHCDDNNKLGEQETDESNGNENGRRVFTTEFKKRVVEAFDNDPECYKNQRATARKFGIHRRQVQKWLKNLGTYEESLEREQSSSPEKVPSAERFPLVDYSYLEKYVKQIQNNGTLPKEKEDEHSLRSPVSRDNLDTQVENSVHTSKCRTDSAASLSPTDSEAYDLSKMSSSSMALSLNLSLNATNQSNYGFGTSSNSAITSNRNGTNKDSINSIMKPDALLRFLPNPNIYNFPANGIARSSEHQVESPANLSTTNSSGERTPQHSFVNKNYRSNHFGATPLDIVDEIARIYPHEDFSLLRQALMRNEVSFMKVKKSPSTAKSSADTPTINQNGMNSEKAESLSPVKSATGEAALAQQSFSLDLFRQQNEYLRILQSSGFGLPFPNSDFLNSIYSNADPKYSTWFHSLANASPHAHSSNNHLSTALTAGQRKQNLKRSDETTFATPKLPSCSSSSAKPKTVAAALAASRDVPSRNSNGSKHHSSTQSGKSKPQRKKQRSRHNNASPNKSPSSASDEFIDPTSMLELVTTAPAIENVNINANFAGKEIMQNIPTSGNPLDFLNQLLLQSPSSFVGKNKHPDIPKSFENQFNALSQNGGITSGIYQTPVPSEGSNSEMTKNKVLHTFVHDRELSGDARAIARKFGLNVRVVMKWIKESSLRQTSTSNGLENQSQVSPSQNFTASCAKLSANGDSPNGQAINQDLPALSRMYFSTIKMNGDSGNNESEPEKYSPGLNGNEQLSPSSANENPYKPTTSNSISFNKRKTSRPNQICDFVQDDGFDEPVDMMIRSKTRRLNTTAQ